MESDDDKLHLFTDETGTGPLFFEFPRIKNILHRIQPEHFFWIFENVAVMSSESLQIIVEYVSEIYFQNHILTFEEMCINIFHCFYDSNYCNHNHSDLTFFVTKIKKVLNIYTCSK